MTIIHKYITGQIIKFFGIVLIVVICLYLAIDFFEKVDDFLEKGVPLSRALIYFLYQTPLIMSLVFPVGILLSVLITFGLMNKHNEIIALKSSGISIYYLLRPVLAIGLIASVFLFIISEIVVPMTANKAHVIWQQEVMKSKAISTRTKDIWTKDKGSIIHIKHYNPNKKMIAGITLNYFDDNFNLIKRIDAKTGVFKNDQWILYNLIEQTFDADRNNLTNTFHDEKPLAFNFSPEDLKDVVKNPMSIGYLELRKYIDRMEAEGYDATPYRVDLYSKISMPFSCFVMCLLAIGIAARGRLKDGLSISIAYGLGITFVYIIFYSLCVAFGRGEILPSMLAVWIANIIFLCFGIFALINVE